MIRYALVGCKGTIMIATVGAKPLQPQNYLEKQPLIVYNVLKRVVSPAEGAGFFRSQNDAADKRSQTKSL